VRIPVVDPSESVDQVPTLATSRDATEWLIETAGTVPVTRNGEHAYQQVVAAGKGIDC